MAAWNSNGLTVRTATGTTDTILGTDDVIVYTNTAAKAVSLPSSAARQPGKVYHLVNRAAGAVTVTPASGTIDGAATLVVAATTGRAVIVNDGTNWITVSSVPAAA